MQNYYLITSFWSLLYRLSDSFPQSVPNLKIKANLDVVEQELRVHIDTTSEIIIFSHFNSKSQRHGYLSYWVML